MKTINSVNNEAIKNIVKLKQKKYRDLNKLFLIEGEHLLQMALEHNELKTLIITNEDVEKYKHLSNKVEILIVSEAIIKKISSLKTPVSVIGVAHQSTKQFNPENKVIVLDNIQDPSNLGAILRSALAFGHDHIVLSSNSVDLYNDKVIRASQGAIFALNIYRLPLEEVFPYLKYNNFKILVTSLSEDSIKLNDLEIPEKYALVLGNEGQGVSELSFKNASLKLKIAMSNKIDSLNVGVAAGIILAKLFEDN